MSVHHHSQHSTAAPQLPSVSAWTAGATVAATSSGSATPASLSSPEQWPGYTPIWDYDRHPVAPCVPDSRRPPRHSHPDHILHSEPIDPSSAQYRRRSTRISSSSSSNSSTSSLQLHSSPLPKKSRTISTAASVSAKSGRRPLLSRLLRKPISTPSSTIHSPETIIAQGAVPVSSLPSSPPSESHDRDPNITTQPQPQPQPQSKPQHQHQHQHSHHHSLDSSMSRQGRPSGQRLRTSRSLAPSENSVSSLTSLTEEKQFPHSSTVNDPTGVQSRADNGHRIPSSSLSLHLSTPRGLPSSTPNSPRPSLSQRRRGVAVAAAAFNENGQDPAESKAAAAALSSTSAAAEQQQQLQQRSPMEEQQLRWHQDWLRPSGAMLSRFRDRPARFNCPRCGAKVVSVTQFVPGVMSYLVAFGLLFLTLGTLSYVPFRKGHEGTKDCVHWCPKCNQKVARYSRATATWEWL